MANTSVHVETKTPHQTTTGNILKLWPKILHKKSNVLPPDVCGEEDHLSPM